MGTVLSFSPRENHPIYSTHHQHHHRGSGTMSTSSSTDFSLNNYAYEQMNNIVSNNTNGSSLVLFGTTNSNIMNNNLSTTNAISPDERHSDSARILSEKNAIEKNLKKHSLFINALSWKRLSASHGKKKLESYNTKNKSANLTTFRPPALTDQVHPMMVVANEKNKNYQQQQIHFANNSNNNLNNNLNISSHAKDNLHTQSNIYFSPGPKNLTLDLQNSNNANLQHHHVEKLGPKIPLQLPLSLQSNAMHHHHHHQPTQPQSQQQQQQHYRPGPRKTIIQVS
jgi:cyclin-dependent kinase 5 activator 1